MKKEAAHCSKMCPTTILNGSTTHKTMNSIFTTVKTSNLYTTGWRNHVLRILDKCSTKTVQNYKLGGYHAVGRPRKGWREKI
jgi:hypothetical protein